MFSKVTLTTSCIEFCLANNINVGYFSLNGRYYGRLVSVQNTNVSRLRKQIDLSKDEGFLLRLAQKIIHAKINNQFVVARRYAPSTPDTLENKKIITENDSIRIYQVKETYFDIGKHNDVAVYSSNTAIV